MSEAPPTDVKRGEVRAIRKTNRSVEDALAFINEVVAGGGLRGLVVVRLEDGAGQTTIIDSFGDTDRADLAFAGAMLTAEAIGVN